MRLGLHLLVAILLSTISYGFGVAERSDSAIGLQEFGRLIRALSESEGYFDTDNFVSNERGYLKVLPALKMLGIKGGAYLGVGPDQNYSYIAQVRPQLAVIIDIRRQNALQHLYFKSLFQLSSDRSEYLSRLFGRRLGISGEEAEDCKISLLLQYVEASPKEDAYREAKEAEAADVIRSWNIGLALADFRAIHRIAREFMSVGPDLKFSSYNRPSRPYYPTYRQLLEERDSSGAQRNYLADEESFQFIKRLHFENRILPIVGNLGGSVALRQTAEELRRRGLAVTCFYVSNVEFYIFGRPEWHSYVHNLGLLPGDPNAQLIRSYASVRRPFPFPTKTYYMTTVLEPLQRFLADESNGKIKTFGDVIER